MGSRTGGVFDEEWGTTLCRGDSNDKPRHVSGNKGASLPAAPCTVGKVSPGGDSTRIFKRTTREWF